MPEKWDSKSVKALGEIKLGRQSAPRYRVGDSIRPYLRVVNISNDRLDLRDVKLMDFPGDDANRYALEPGDVLLTEGDLVSANNVGRSAIYRGEIAGCCFQNTLLRFRPNELVTSEFAHYGFCFLRHQGRFAELARATTVFHLSAGRFQDVELPVPPLPEQRKIAAILSSVDEVIEKTEAVIDQLEVVKKGLLGELLARGISGPNRKLKETLIGHLPLSWVVMLATEVCTAIIDCKNRTPPYTESGDLYVVRTSNIRNGELDTSALLRTDANSFLEWTSRGEPRAGDVLITREAPIGEVCVIPTGIRLCLGQRLMLYRPNPELMLGRFLMVALQSEPLQKYLLSLAGGSTVGHIRVGDIRSLPIPVPPLAEQHAIADCLESHAGRLRRERLTLAQLRKVKAALLGALLSGHLRLTMNTQEAA